MPKPHSSFKNQFSTLPQDEFCRVQADVPTATKLFLQSICPGSGLHNYLMQSFYASLEQELKDNGIIYYSPENRNSFIEIVRRRTSTRADSDASLRHDAGGTSPVRNPDSNPSHQSTHIQQGVTSGSGRGRNPARSQVAEGTQVKIPAKKGLVK